MEEQQGPEQNPYDDIKLQGVHVGEEKSSPVVYRLIRNGHTALCPFTNRIAMPPSSPGQPITIQAQPCSTECPLASMKPGEQDGMAYYEIGCAQANAPGYSKRYYAPVVEPQQKRIVEGKVPIIKM